MLNNACSYCPECNASFQGDLTCETSFHQMLYWENEFPDLWAVHHLTVLCFYLQHPSHYSPEGLVAARKLLDDFIVNGISAQQACSHINSNRRNWKIKGTAASHASYNLPVRWTISAIDVAAAGPANYCTNVTRWAQAIHQTLKTLP